MKLDRRRVFEDLGYARDMEVTLQSGRTVRRRYPHPKVMEMHLSPARIKVMLAPARTSKSFSAAWDVVPDVLEAFLEVDEELQSGVPGRFTEGEWAKFLIVGPTYDHADKEFGYLEEALCRRAIQHYGLPEPTVWQRRPDAGRMCIVWGEPYYIEVRAASAVRLQALLGDQWRAVILSETAQLEEKVWTRGLSTRYARALWPTTPSVRGRWIKDFIDRAREQHDAQVAWFEYPPDANPKYDWKRFRNALRQLGPDSPDFQEQFLGRWVFYGGTVFPNFRSEPVEDVTPFLSHKGIEGGEGCVCIQPMPIPDGWRRVGGLDLGWNDPTCLLWAAVSPRGEIIVYDEYYERQKGMAQHLEAIREKSRLNGTREFDYVVRDKHGQGRQVSEEMMLEHDFATLPVPDSDRVSGRLEVQGYMDPGADGLPKLRIVSEACPNLIRELENLHYDEPKMHREGQMEVYKGEDHAYDALRYLLMSRPSRSVLHAPEPGGLTFNALQRHRRRLAKVRRRIGHDRLPSGTVG